MRAAEKLAKATDGLLCSELEEARSACFVNSDYRSLLLYNVTLRDAASCRGPALMI